MHEPSDPMTMEPGPACRTPDGKFACGNPGGRGNPFARRTAELRKLFWVDCTNEALQQIIAAIRAKACKGDMAAAKLYLSYTIGKPEKAVDLSGLLIREAKALLGPPPPFDGDEAYLNPEVQLHGCEVYREAANGHLSGIHGDTTVDEQDAELPCVRQEHDARNDPCAGPRMPGHASAADGHRPMSSDNTTEQPAEQPRHEPDKPSQKKHKRKGRLAKPIKLPGRHQTEKRERAAEAPVHSAHQARQRMFTASLNR